MSQVFAAFPAPGKVYWDLEAPKGQIQVNPGESKNRFTAGQVEDLGNNQYKVDLDIKKVVPKDGEGKYALVVEGAREQDEDQVLVVPIKVASADVAAPESAAPVVPSLPEVQDGKQILPEVTTHY